MAYAVGEEGVGGTRFVGLMRKKLCKSFAEWIPANALRLALLRAAGFRIGRDVYIGEGLIVTEILEDISDKLVIENRVAIAPRVTLVTSSDPNFSRLSEWIPAVRGKIRLRHDCWIGTGVIILPNVTIGAYSIVGAGSVVTKDVPPRTIVAGVPAREIGRVSPRQRKRSLEKALTLRT